MREEREALGQSFRDCPPCGHQTGICNSRIGTVGCRRSLAVRLGQSCQRPAGRIGGQGELRLCCVWGAGSGAAEVLQAK